MLNVSIDRFVSETQLEQDSKRKKNKSYKPNGVAEIILPPYKTHEHDLNFVIHESAAAIAVGVTCLTLLC